MAEPALYSRIKERAPALTPTQARIAAHVTHDLQGLAHSTVRELSLTIGVSNSAVVRFAQALGFGGFPELQAAARSILSERLSIVQRFASTQEAGKVDRVEQTLLDDLQNLERTSRGLSRETLANAAKVIGAARRVYVVGYRNAAAMGMLLSATLSQVLESVVQVTADFGDAPDKLAGLSTKDVVVAIAFPRYARFTVKAAKFAQSRGCTVIAVTDGPASPIAKGADFAFFAWIESAMLPYSYVGVVELINAMIVAVTKETANHAAQRLKAWEEAVQHLGLLGGSVIGRTRRREAADD